MGGVLFPANSEFAVLREVPLMSTSPSGDSSAAVAYFNHAPACLSGTFMYTNCEMWLYAWVLSAQTSMSWLLTAKELRVCSAEGGTTYVHFPIWRFIGNRHLF